MPEPTRRKRFQIHLSTAIVLMFVAGGLLWVNLKEHPKGVTQRSDANGNSWSERYDILYGWPCDAALHFKGYNAVTPGRWDVLYSNIAIDFAVGLSILITVWDVSESLIQRRAARKGA